MPVWMLVLAITIAPNAATAPSVPAAEVKVTQRYLVPLCLDGSAVTAGQRRWRLPAGAHSLAFTMRSDARSAAQGNAATGVATVPFTVEAGHRYEVEVRAPVLTFSSRSWTAREWKPLVRDRTRESIVSDEPEWNGSGCAKAESLPARERPAN